eukprot:Blabericola_migrator_1__7116@NODE_3601_length_1647_cov_10_403165_g2237_i0_p1_GENE_NODE_3601_length_1647_cov_10_403165_g2237_i0NODE_3601_length_1647_cov_10_403165_g2237_i0_p1_ORF_typecomplete_len520_score56_90rve/PF00665_26/2_3e22Integrase_H2C2/PF17921_1/3_7e16Integrase_H2C2/PF17921_1/1e03zfH2C2/PF09337_10/4_2e09MLVIN_C/PF18697_1/0_00067DDE_2/PF02914_15/0_00087_NODE_3601_length_1647_cov_10_403165_g2237_i0881467
MTQDFKQYIPHTLRERLLHQVHTRHSQHYGSRKTTEMILQKYWWPNLRTQVKEYVSSCITCSQSKSGYERRQGLQQMIQAHDVMDIVQMDVIGPMDPTTKGNRYLLTYIDTFSRTAWATPLARADSAEISEALLKDWILWWGPPKRILTDNAAYFTCDYFPKFLATFNTLLIHSAPWHPQGHSHIERFNRHIQQSLRMDLNPQDWDDNLHQALYNHNKVPCDTTGIAPLELMFNRPPPPPIIMEDLMKDINDRRLELSNKRLKALERMEATRTEMNERTNKGRYDISINIGDYIAIRTHNPNKLQPRFDGCYEVTRKVGTTLFYNKGTREHQINISDVHKIPRQLLEDEPDTEISDGEDGAEGGIQADVDAEAELTNEILTQPQVEQSLQSEEAQGSGRHPQTLTERTTQRQQRSAKTRIPDIQPPKPRQPIRFIEVENLPKVPKLRRGWRRRPPEEEE